MGKRITGIIVLILGLSLIVRIGTNVIRLYKAGGRVSEQEERLEEVKKENEELKQKLAEVQTPEYMEREAREKLGMGKEGEVVLIIPEEELQVYEEAVHSGGEDEPNWVKWRKLYLGW